MLNPHFLNNASCHCSALTRFFLFPRSFQHEGSCFAPSTINGRHHRGYCWFASCALLLLLVFAVLPARAQSVGDGVQVTNVNDWGSGFIATFEYEVRAEDAPLTDWTFDLGYSGSAQLVNTWMSGYGGGINSGYTGAAGGYQ